MQLPLAQRVIVDDIQRCVTQRLGANANDNKKLEFDTITIDNVCAVCMTLINNNDERRVCQHCSSAHHATHQTRYCDICNELLA
jgi:hypothetical protein